MKTCLILNPAAGSAGDDDTLGRVLRAVGSCEVHQAASPQDARTASRAAVEQGFERIVVGGGDGTLHQVLNGVSPDFERIELAVVPLGTGNDFARTIGILSVDDAMRSLRSPTPRRLDVVHVQACSDVSKGFARYFLNTSGGGFSAVLGSATQSEFKEWWGSLAYVVKAAQSLPELQTYRIELRFDDGPTESTDAYNVVIANGRYIGGGIPIAPESRLNDGKVDIVIVPKIGAARLTLLVTKVLLGEHLTSGDIMFRRASRVSISSEPRLPLNVDGEYLGKSAAEYRVHPGALRVLVHPDLSAPTT